jgi:8-oxo-dGTP pyrophosphatase MutT (NUDIX family)
LKLDGRWNELHAQDIQDAIGKYSPKRIINSDRQKYTHAAVLIPVLWYKQNWNILFTRRTETVQHHKGQVSFPGGAMEPEDQIPENTALRETREEIGILSENVHIIGRLDEMITITKFIITPIVAFLDWPVPIKLSTEEVNRVFTIPFSWLAEEKNHDIKSVRRDDGHEDLVVFYEMYDGEKLWGITAKLTLEFIQRLKMK